MHDSKFRTAVFIIIAVSVLLRLGFRVFGDVLPVMWDARRYAAAGLALISYVDDSGTTQEPREEREDRYQFKHYYDKYLQGEKIEWLMYTPHSLSLAREEIFFSGPLYPLILATVMFLSPVADFTIIRLVGIGFDVLANLLLMLVAFRLIGRRAAVLAGAIYAAYFPFIMTSTMLLLETSTGLLILLTLYLLLRGSESNRLRPLILAGLCTGGLVLNKPTAMLLVVPFMIGWAIYTRGNWRTSLFVNRSLFYLTPVAVVFIGWTAIASSHYGEIALRDPEYAGANIRQSSSMLYEGYDLDRVEPGFWERPYLQNIADDPVGYGGLLIKKFDRLWTRPYNDFRKDFILPAKGNEFFHLVVVVAGLLGLLLLLRNNLKSGAWPLLIIGYYTGIHLIFHSISRYNFQAMTMVMLGAAYGLILLGESWQKKERLTGIFAALAVLLAAWLIDPHWFNAVTGAGLSRFVVILMVLLKGALLLYGLILLVKPVFRFGRARLVIPATVAFFITIVGASNTLSRNDWAEFKCPLTNPQTKAGIRLHISNLPPVAENDLLALMIDINAAEDTEPKPRFTLGLGERTQNFTLGEPPLSQGFYPKPTYRFYSQFIPMPTTRFRQYAAVPLDPSAVRNQLERLGYFEVWLSTDADNAVNLWGKMPADSEDKHYIPGWRFSSIERFVHEDDPRIRYPVKYLSDSTVSYYIPRTQTNPAAGEDLSPLAGKQTGRYNIFLMHFKPDGSVRVY